MLGTGKLGEPDRVMLETQLVKDRNRIADSLADARAAVEDCRSHRVILTAASRPVRFKDARIRARS